MDELQALVAGIRERVRARHSATGGGVGEIRVPDLMPVLHARDAAFAKVAAIGKVNPRRGGLINGIIQWLKRGVSRALDWHVREQVEFNHATVRSVEAVLAALEENNRVLRELAAWCGEARDIRAHWITWRSEWERKLSTNEAQFLRSTADLQTAFQHRVTLMESAGRELMQAQHKDFEGALERTTHGIQKQLWADLEKIRLEYLNLIQQELRTLRQRPPVVAAASGPVAAQLDYWLFSEKFRGPESYVRGNQQFYVDRFRACGSVLDIGCGRGEFLDSAREAGIAAKGVDLNPEFVAHCRLKGHAAEHADLFGYLEAEPDRSLKGIFCSQVIEHLPPPALPQLIRLAARKLVRGGVLAIETPNPECLAIFATHFYLDPTHTRPVPPALLEFYFVESGFAEVEVHRFVPAVESMPEVAALPAAFREKFFGSLDYAVIGKAS